MSTSRLTFLYPHLFRATRAAQSQGQKSLSAQGRTRRVAAPFSTSARAREAVFERHGKAVEPSSSPPDAVKLPRLDNDAIAASPEPTTTEAKAEQPNEQDAEAETPREEATIKTEPTPAEAAGGKKPSPQQIAADVKMQSSGPMDAVLHMPPPTANTHPHISTPPYVHHFDSYTLVKHLESGGYSKDQAITVMKAVRTLLAQNLDVAQDGLVSKSDVDNETYLFRAACSELSSEVVNNRRVADEHMRQQRTVLQHEVDILGQRLSQDLMTLRDDVRGMFNDRKMAVREEQKRMESAIQQVNLDISVTLNSDAKSDIEGLRWVLIRRSVLGILFMAVLTLGTIRYATHLGHVQEKEAEQKAREAESMRRNNGRLDHAPAPDAAEILAAN